MKFFVLGSFLSLAAGVAVAGPFPSAADPASRVTPAEVAAWARGVADYSPAPGVTAPLPAAALGYEDGAIVSLGDLDATQIAAGDAPGEITLTFAGAAFDGPGPDLAIFENAFDFSFSGLPDYFFVELGYVEVSTNGVDFARFPSTSLNIENDEDETLEPGELFVDFDRTFAGADTTNIHNLAGVHGSGFGTPFDLADLTTDPLVISGVVDLNEIRFVRVIDIPGDGSFVDSLGNPILDAWLTVGSGGLDLDAVGVIHFVPEPSTASLVVFALAAMGRRRRRGA